MKYNLVKVGDQSNITVFVDGEMYVADSNHPNWTAIVEAVLEDDDNVTSLFDVAQTVAQSFESLSERVTVANGRVYFDGDEVDNSVTRQIVRFLGGSEMSFLPLVRFMENLAENPNSHSRSMLYDWLRDRDFTITDDGCFVAYKGVRPSDNKYYSISQGTAIVNGQKITGNIPQEIGDVVTMPRSQVAFDPGTGCSTGLHAGTWGYASNFGQGAVLTVEINPRDVVSVPTDCNSQKLRVCRYRVLNVVEVPYTEPLYDFDDDKDVISISFTNYQDFTSTLIDGAYFDAESNLIYVLFNNSEIVRRYDCTPDQWDEFVRSASPGRFWNEHFKYADVTILVDVDFVYENRQYTYN